MAAYTVVPTSCAPKFEDAMHMHQLYPETFDVPSAEELNELKIGDSVKLCCNGERFWTKIIDMIDGKFLGVVNNRLVRNVQINMGSIVEFERRHIYAIYDEEAALVEYLRLNILRRF